MIRRRGSRFRRRVARRSSVGVATNCLFPGALSSPTRASWCARPRSTARSGRPGPRPARARRYRHGGPRERGSCRLTLEGGTARHRRRSGIGLETALTLAELGADVASRPERRGRRGSGSELRRSVAGRSRWPATPRPRRTWSRFATTRSSVMCRAVRARILGEYGRWIDADRLFDDVSASTSRRFLVIRAAASRCAGAVAGRSSALEPRRPAGRARMAATARRRARCSTGGRLCARSAASGSG